MSHPTQEFSAWWRDHPQSGYFVEGPEMKFPGMIHWGIKPKTAWEIARYR